MSFTHLYKYKYSILQRINIHGDVLCVLCSALIIHSNSVMSCILFLCLHKRILYVNIMFIFIFLVYLYPY